MKNLPSHADTRTIASINCPHCQKELPENYGAVYCPFCGKDLPSENSELAPECPQKKLNGALFSTALLLPPSLTLLSVVLMRFVISVAQVNEGVSPMVALIGGVIGGVVCGTLLGTRAGRTLPGQIGLSIIFSAMMIVVCVMLCFFGCGIGGYQMRIGG